MAPHGIYPCSGDDDWIAIVCRNQGEWATLAGMIGQLWTSDYATLQIRLERQDELDIRMLEWTRGQGKFDLQAKLRERQIPAAAVQKPQERIENDPATEPFGLWPTVEHTEMGEVRVDGIEA